MDRLLAARPTGRPTGRSAALLGLVAGCLLTLLLTALLIPDPATARGGWSPPPDTVVSVQGTAAEGFAIRHYDGSMLYPPTTSEAIAECGELAGQRDRIRCRTRVRVWHRDLGGLRDTLRWASQRR